jgi:hypothetical protein
MNRRALLLDLRDLLGKAPELLAQRLGLPTHPDRVHPYLPRVGWEPTHLSGLRETTPRIHLPGVPTGSGDEPRRVPATLVRGNDPSPRSIRSEVAATTTSLLVPWAGRPQPAARRRACPGPPLWQAGAEGLHGPGGVLTAPVEAPIPLAWIRRRAVWKIAAAASVPAATCQLGGQSRGGQPEEVSNTNSNNPAA